MKLQVPKNMAGDHLSDDQITALLAGSPDDLPQSFVDEADEHLQQCAACRAQIEEFREAVSGFSMASLAWAEARPSPSLRARAAERERGSGWGFVRPGWSTGGFTGFSATAAAAAIAVLLSIPLWPAGHHPALPTSSAHGDSSAAASSAPLDSQAQIAADNSMMANVDVALGWNDDSQLDAYAAAYRANGRVTRPGKVETR